MHFCEHWTIFTKQCNSIQNKWCIDAMQWMQSRAVWMSVRHQFTLDLISMHRVYPHLPITGISSRIIAANSKRALVLNDNISSRISTKTRLICRAEEVMNFVPKWLLTNLCENFAHLEVKIWPTWRSLLISIDNLFGNWNLLKTKLPPQSKIQNFVRS